jgi:hypothetical protein
MRRFTSLIKIVLLIILLLLVGIVFGRNSDIISTWNPIAPPGVPDLATWNPIAPPGVPDLATWNPIAPPGVPDLDQNSIPLA